MKRYLFFILIVTFAYSLICNEQEYKEIEISELLMKFLPSYKIRNRIPIEGIGQRFAIAKNTGEIVIVTNIDNKINIILFNKNGEKHWQKVLTDFGYDFACSISNNGTAIIITNYYNETVSNFVLDNNGNLLFEKKLKDIQLKACPNGRFFYEDIGAMAGRRRGAYIYNRKGESIKIVGYNFDDYEHIRIKFVNDSTLFTYMKNKFVFLNFNNGHVKQFNEYPLSDKDYFGMGFKDHTLISSKYIFVSNLFVDNQGPKSKTRVFSTEGQIIFSDDNYYSSASFVSEDIILAYSNTNKGKYLNTINLNNKETVKFSESPNFESNKSNNPFYEAKTFDYCTLYSIRRFSWDKFTFPTLIVTNKDNSHFTSNYSFIKSENYIFAFKQYSQNTELVIMRKI